MLEKLRRECKTPAEMMDKVVSMIKVMVTDDDNLFNICMTLSENLNETLNIVRSQEMTENDKRKESVDLIFKTFFTLLLSLESEDYIEILSSIKSDNGRIAIKFQKDEENHGDRPVSNRNRISASRGRKAPGKKTSGIKTKQK